MTQEGHLFTFSMRTTVDYMHMEFYLESTDNINVFNVKSDMAVFYTGAVSCQRSNWWSSSTDMEELWQHLKFGRHSRVAAYLSRNSSII